jgi:hypothetical protein
MALSVGEELIGVIWSDYLMLGPHHYSLIITPSRIIGCRKKPLWQGFTVYLGPGSKATTADREKAQKVVAKLMAAKDFEFPKDSIVKIVYKKPGLFSGGYVNIHTTGRGLELVIGYTAGNQGTLRALVPSLMIFAGDRFYDEKTGALVEAEVLQRAHENGQD